MTRHNGVIAPRHRLKDARCCDGWHAHVDGRAVVRSFVMHAGKLVFRLPNQWLEFMHETGWRA